MLLYTDGSALPGLVEGMLGNWQLLMVVWLKAYWGIGNY